MTSCRCGNIAVYRVTKRGITIPSVCGQFCNVCLRKDSWYAVHYHDYKIEQIQYDTKCCTNNVVQTTFNTVQHPHNFIVPSDAAIDGQCAKCGLNLLDYMKTGRDCVEL